MICHQLKQSRQITSTFTGPRQTSLFPKAARPAAPCATYCYPTTPRQASVGGFRSPVIVVDFEFTCAVSSEFSFKHLYDFAARNSVRYLKSFVVSRNMEKLYGQFGICQLRSQRRCAECWSDFIERCRGFQHVSIFVHKVVAVCSRFKPQQWRPVASATRGNQHDKNERNEFQEGLRSRITPALTERQEKV